MCRVWLDHGRLSKLCQLTLSKNLKPFSLGRPVQRQKTGELQSEHVSFSTWIFRNREFHRSFFSLEAYYTINDLVTAANLPPYCGQMSHRLWRPAFKHSCLETASRDHVHLAGLVRRSRHFEETARGFRGWLFSCNRTLGLNRNNFKLSQNRAKIFASFFNIVLV